MGSLTFGVCPGFGTGMEEQLRQALRNYRLTIYLRKFRILQTY